MVRTDMAGSGIKIHTGGRAFNTVSSIYLKILKINHLTAHNFPNLGGLGGYPPILPLRCRLKEGVHSINAIEKRTSIFSGISVADFLDSQGSLCCLNGLDG